MTETPAALTNDRLATDLAMVPVYQPTTYLGRMTGQGSWFMLRSGDQELGWVWTNGGDGLGFISTTDPGRVATASIVTGFQGAAKAGTPAADVFAWWAGQASQGYNAGPVQTGDLDTLA